MKHTISTRCLAYPTFIMMGGLRVDIVPIPNLQNIYLSTDTGRKGARMAQGINSHAQVHLKLWDGKGVDAVVVPKFQNDSLQW